MPVGNTDSSIERRTGLERRRSLLTRWPGGYALSRRSAETGKSAERSWLKAGRRAAGRRASDRIYPSIDLHSPRVLTVALSIMLLCCCDGFLTIALLARGAVEANPFMALLMQAGMGWFSGIKLMLTAMGVLVLVVCSPMRLFRRIPGELALHMLLGCYLVLVAYELWLGF